ncbi:hypothetical protein MUO32_07735 [Shinella sp. CPCC 101442]|uniref:hypothetical protein n=1 Tax=Shinella sp. CPCC 101442 TaxID=2932265 RepID=UPI00215354C8|nr:hypothetical protein [Shinella sp. CPCC 101442]MCR6498916.1 hypothetical protein [Shinella sp. CPCC 101442]
MDAAIDLQLFGVSPEPAVYDGLGGRRVEVESGVALLLDTKADAPLDPFLDMQAMLLEMTKELRERFQRFQSQKILAERDADGAEDEASRKLAQTDAKAAIEAVSLIVRTLEKIDSLQRTLIGERAEAEAARGEPEDEAVLAAEFDRLVERRVKERLDAAKEDWTREARPGGDAAARAESGP